MVIGMSLLYLDVMGRYKDKFGGPPDTFDDPRSETEWIEMMQQAIATNTPIPPVKVDGFI